RGPLREAAAQKSVHGTDGLSRRAGGGVGEMAGLGREDGIAGPGEKGRSHGTMAHLGASERAGEISTQGGRVKWRKGVTPSSAQSSVAASSGHPLLRDPMAMGHMSSVQN